MSAVVAPDELECYLLSILDTPDGLDLAESYIAEDQLVLTDVGWRPIQGVQVGQQVLTHRNRWRRVSAVHERGEREVVEVKGRGHPGLQMTPDHELYVRRVRKGLRSVEGHRTVFLQEPEWLPAENLEFGELGQQRVRPTRWATPAVIEPLPVDADLPWDSLDLSWLWVFGRWLADGTVNQHERAGDRAGWHVPLRKQAAVEKALAALGLRHNAQVGNNVSQDIATIRVYGKTMVGWLLRNGGRRADGKRLPSWLLGATDEQRRAVFAGLIAGDGWTDGTGAQHYSTISPALAYGVRLLAASLGYSCSLTRDEQRRAVKFGAERTCATSYRLTMSPSGGQAVFEGGHCWSPVQSRRAAGRALVWDLSVEEDHSFVVEGVVVQPHFGTSPPTAVAAGCGQHSRTGPTTSAFR